MEVQPIQTARLELKPYVPSDLRDMLRLLMNPSIRRTFMIPDFPSQAEAAAMFEKLRLYSLSPMHFERGIFLHGKLIGFLNDVSMTEDTIELGYVIHPAYQNLGYATEALQACIQALQAAGFTRVITGAFTENLASIRVMEKCGMHRSARFETILYQGKLHDCCYYEITLPPAGSHL